MMNEQLIKKAKEAKSVEELLTLAKENDLPMDGEGAKEIFGQLHTKGELCDDELGSVSGGGCACYTKVNGHKYVIVTPDLDCFNNQFEKNFREYIHFKGATVSNGFTLILDDHEELRTIWLRPGKEPVYRVCGNCQHLKFKCCTGYCGLT